jgi:hypothetical protein
MGLWPTVYVRRCPLGLLSSLQQGLGGVPIAHAFLYDIPRHKRKFSRAVAAPPLRDATTKRACELKVRRAILHVRDEPHKVRVCMCG